MTWNKRETRPRAIGPRRLWSWIGLVLLLMHTGADGVLAAAPTPSDIEEQNLRARQQATERQQREQQTDVFLQKGTKQAEDTSLPEESLSFVITRLQLEGDSVDRFSWVQDGLNKYTGRKIGLQGVNLIVKRLTNALIDRGYITTRIVIPEQDLSSGTLKLVLVPGRIGTIRFAEKSVRGHWQNAFPTGPGDILNLRHLEQGLEQMKRVPSRDVDMQLVPGKHLGESDIVITVKQHRPARLTIAADDSGTEATGKIRLSETFSLDNLFGLNDLFSITKNSDGEGGGSRYGMRGDSIYYSIPYKDATFSISNRHYNYHQTIATATQPFVFSGENDSTEFHLSKLIHRNQNSKTSLECAVIKSHIRSYLEDTEIVAQRKDTTAFELGLSYRRYCGRATFHLEIAHKQGVPWFGAQPDVCPESGTTRYSMWLVDTTLTTPVALGKVKANYRLTFHGQYTGDTLYQTDMLSIGNRYTVRGFDGEETLSGEKGWYLQNEIAIPLGRPGLQAYLGLDYGIVYGPYTQNLLGRTLAGSVVGLRGGAKKVNYDLFIGWPLHKPSGFKTGSPTYGFMLVVR